MSVSVSVSQQGRCAEANSPKTKGATGSKLICHQGRSLLNIGTFSDLIAQLSVLNS